MEERIVTDRPESESEGPRAHRAAGYWSSSLPSGGQNFRN
jgi:hypothetical protein